MSARLGSVSLRIAGDWFRISYTVALPPGGYHLTIKSGQAALTPADVWNAQMERQGDLVTVSAHVRRTDNEISLDLIKAPLVDRPEAWQ